VSTSSPAGSAASPASDRAGVADSWIVYEGPITGGDGNRAGNRMVRPDGTGDHWVTPDVPLPASGWQVHPDWSPDGQRVAFAADDARQDGADLVTRDLWVSDANGGQLDRVLDCELPCLEADDPAWSPDGRTLAFAMMDAKGDVNVNIRIAVLDLQTRRVRTIARAAGTDNVQGPRWSPDGRTLVFEVQHYTNQGPTGTITGTAVATVPVTDHVAAATVITPKGMWATYPDWHPTQDLVLFSTRPWTDLGTGPSNLFTARSDGSHLTQITHFAKGQTRATQPTFTPDGSHIMFTAVEGDDFGNPTMAVIALDGSGLTSATASGQMFGTHPRLRPTVK
jgi:Tol biopolymer transport system component